MTASWEFLFVQSLLDPCTQEEGEVNLGIHFCTCFKRERKAEKDEEVRDILSSVIYVFHKPLSMPMCPCTTTWGEHFLPSIKLLCYDLVKFIDQSLSLLGGVFRFSCVDNGVFRRYNSHIWVLCHLFLFLAFLYHTEAPPQC